MSAQLMSVLSRLQQCMIRGQKEQEETRIVITEGPPGSRVNFFYSTTGHADTYENLEIKYISGLSPELKLYDSEDRLMDKIDISRKTTDQIHDLVGKIWGGFTRHG